MRRLVLLLGLAVLALGIWVMVRSVGGEAVPLGVARSIEPAEPVPGPALRGAETVGEETVEATEAGFERSEVEAVEAAVGEHGELVPVLVLNKETGDPIPGAEVSYITDTQSLTLMQEVQGRQEEFMALARDQEKLANRYGTTVFADGKGLAFVPVKEYTSIVGRHGELFGQVTVRANPPQPLPDGHKLELEQDLTLVIKVLDSRGEPAVGVPIALVPQYKEGKGRPTYGNEITRSEAPDGLATIPHMQFMTRGWERQQPAPIGFLVRPFIPGLDEGGEPFDGATSVEEPLILQLPPTGRVVVKTTDGRGEPLQVQLGNPSLAIAPDEPPPDLSRYSPPWNKQWRAEQGEEGVTVFDWVVAGRTYIAMAYLGMENVKEIFPGPLVADQEFHVTLSAGTDIYLFVGRVLDQAREPMGNAELEINYEHKDGGWGSAQFRTDDGGFFRVPIQNYNREITVSRLTIQSGRRFFPASENTASYTSTEERSLIVGDNNLGDVILQSTPVIASGRILVDGEPARGTRFYNNFQVDVLASPSGSRTAERWDQKQDVSVRVKEGGRFEVVGVFRSARHRLYSYFDPRHLPMDPVEFFPGAEDVVINLWTGGSLQAVVLIDEEIPLENLWLQVEPTEGQVPEPTDTRFAIMNRHEYRLRGQFSGKEDGRYTFQWNSLWPGGYRFEVTARGASVPLVEVLDIQIAAGERNEDARLDGIDLRGKFRTIVVRVVGTDGRPIPETNYGPPVVVINNRAEDAVLGGYSAQDGSASILTRERYLDLLVLQRGYKPVELNGITSDTTVTLEPFPEVVVRIAGGLPRLPEGHALRVSLSKKERQRDRRRLDSNSMMGGSVDMWLRPITTTQAVGDSGEIRLQVEGDGTHTVRVSVRNNSTRRSIPVRDIEPADIEVRASLGEQVFEIRIPEEGLKAAMETAAGR